VIGQASERSAATARRTKVFFNTRRYTPDSRAFLRSTVRSRNLDATVFGDRDSLCVGYLCRHLSYNRFFVVQIETHRSVLLSSHNTTGKSRRTYGDLNQKLCCPSPASRKSCSGTPSAQGAFAIKPVTGAPAVFDDLPAPVARPPTAQSTFSQPAWPDRREHRAHGGGNSNLAQDTDPWKKPASPFQRLNQTPSRLLSRLSTEKDARPMVAWIMPALSVRY
jgi:hypothetical protein